MFQSLGDPCDVINEPGGATIERKFDLHGPSHFVNHFLIGTYVNDAIAGVVPCVDVGRNYRVWKRAIFLWERAF
jgi:hypothetical protein